MLPKDELIEIVFDGNFEMVHRDFRDTLFDKIFDSHSELTLHQAGRVSYDRCRFIHARIDEPLDLVANPQKLFALAEWPSLVDIACFSLLMVHCNLTLGTLYDHGADREDIAPYIEELNTLAAFGPYMATELGYGNNVAALRTEAIYDHAAREFVLNTPDILAQKYMSYSGFKDIPKIAVVLARLKVQGKDCGVFPFIIRLSTEHGLTENIRTSHCPEKPVQGLDNGLTWFDHARIPATNILLGGMAEITEAGEFKPKIGNARARFLQAMSRIVPGRLCVASAAVGMARASVYIALRYAQNRLTNGPGTDGVPVIDYRSHQLATFTALAKAYAMTLLVNATKRDYVAQIKNPSQEILALVNIVKPVSTWEMEEVARVCRERCGAQGIFNVNRISDYILLLQGLITAEGDNQVLLATVALQMLARPWSGEVPQVLPINQRHGVDSAWMIELLHHREYQLRETAKETKARTEESEGYFGALNNTVNTGIEMARLHGVRHALQHLYAAARNAENTDVASALSMLCSLYAISELRREAGWFAALGMLSAQEVLTLPQQADRLCAELKPHIPMLLEGFALSPELLRAPIAYEDYAAEFTRCAYAGA
jgi:acyl-CoA oxidase